MASNDVVVERGSSSVTLRCKLTTKYWWGLPLSLFLFSVIPMEIFAPKGQNVGIGIYIIGSVPGVLGACGIYWSLGLLLNRHRIAATSTDFRSTCGPIPLFKPVCIPKSEAVEFFAYEVSDGSGTDHRVGAFSTSHHVISAVQYVRSLEDCHAIVSELNSFYKITPTVIEGYEDADYGNWRQTPAAGEELLELIPDGITAQHFTDRLVITSKSAQMVSNAQMGCGFVCIPLAALIAMGRLEPTIWLIVSFFVILGIFFFAMMSQSTTITATPSSLEIVQKPVRTTSAPKQLARSDFIRFDGDTRLVSSKGSTTAIFCVVARRDPSAPMPDSLWSSGGPYQILYGLASLQDARAVAEQLNRYYGITLPQQS